MQLWIERLHRRLVRSLASERFWYFTLGLFVLQAVWLACSAAYPMAFDEQYHFGLIQLHAHQLLPFFTHQPSTGQYGAVVRDPSYLYHWIMSWPYRVVSFITKRPVAQIIVLRLVNVALFAGALVLYRRLMRRLGVSLVLANGSSLAFVLIPVVPFLAATINYDNLLMVIVPWAILLTLDVLHEYSEQRVPLARIVILLSILMLGSLVKYSFLPVAAVVGAFLVIAMWRNRLFAQRVWVGAWKAARQLSGWRQGLLILLLIVSCGLFAERYAVNVLRYHMPAPNCSQVIGDQACLQYGPWARNYQLIATKSAGFHPNILQYAYQWLDGMWYRLFFAIGPEPDYHTNSPLFVLGFVAIIVAATLLLGMAIQWRRLFVGRSDRLLLLLIMFSYSSVLFADNFVDYAQTAQPVAINGRYLLPFLPLFFVLGGLAWSSLLKLRRFAYAKTCMLTIVLAIFLLQGGGAVTYIVRGDDSWYWPNTTVRHVNQSVRTVVSPLIIGKNLRYF